MLTLTTGIKCRCGKEARVKLNGYRDYFCLKCICDFLGTFDKDVIWRYSTRLPTVIAKSD